MWDDNDKDPMLTHRLTYESSAFQHVEIVKPALVARFSESIDFFVTRLVKTNYKKCVKSPVILISQGKGTEAHAGAGKTFL